MLLDARKCAYIIRDNTQRGYYEDDRDVARQKNRCLFVASLRVAENRLRSSDLFSPVESLCQKVHFHAGR